MGELTVSTVNDERIIVNSGNSPFTLISGKTYTAAPSMFDGGAMQVQVNGTASGDSVSFIGNTTNAGGGAIFVAYDNSSAGASGSLTLSGTNCLAGNTATNGGAIYVDGNSDNQSLLQVGGTCSFSNNSSALSGGAICVGGIAAFDEDSVVIFTGNTAGQYGYGGAVYVADGGTVSFANGAIFSGNTAGDENSGAICNGWIIVIGGEMDLQTASDTWYNGKGSAVTWDLTAGRNCSACITNFQQYSNDDNVRQEIQVSSENDGSLGACILAYGDLSDLASQKAKNFYLTGVAGLDDKSIKVDYAAVTYDNNNFALYNLNNQYLTLSVFETVTSTAKTVTSGTGTSDDPYEINQGDDVFMRVFNSVAVTIESGAYASATDMQFLANVNAGGYGGAISNSGNLEIKGRADYIGNIAKAGAAIFNKSAVFGGGGMKFYGNTAGENGGAIRNTSGSSLTLGRNLYFVGNHAGENGGAVSNVGTFELLESNYLFKNNTADKNGGALDNELTMTLGADLIFTGNTAGVYGGAINNSSDLSLSSAQFTGNSAGMCGGAINNSGNLRLFGDVTFCGNDAMESGAIENEGNITMWGTVDLQTETDTWFNEKKASVCWDISGGVENYGSVTGFQYYRNEDNSVVQTITVDDEEQEDGEYIIATGDFSDWETDDTGKYYFTFNDLDDKTLSEAITVNESILFNDKNYSLSIAAIAGSDLSQLVLTAGGEPAEPVTRADFNASDRSDVVMISGTKLSVLADNAKGTYVKSKTLSNLGKWTLVEPEGDYNGDTRADVLITSKTDGIRTLAGLFNIGVDSQIKFKGHNIFRYKTDEWSYRAKGDVNGDGTTDIVIVLKGEKAVEMGLKGRVVQAKTLNENGKVGETVKMGMLKSGECVLSTADVTGKGKSNILVWNVKNDLISYWKTAGAELTGIGTASGLNFLAAGDLNGDSADELVWQKEDGTYSLWENLAGENLKKIDLGAQKSGWTFQQLGDYNGDGKQELLWAANDGRLAYSGTDKITKLTVIAK